jgi:predicted outer membrane repeat protein
MNTKFLASAWRVLLALIFSLSLAGISAQQVRAATYDVSILADSGAGSLRQAILDANASAGADTITFSVSGMIVLGSSLPIITDDLVIDGSGYSVTISGNNLYRVMHINTGKSVTLIYLSIYAGSAPATSGGGVDNGGGTLTVTNCSFSYNSAGWGGGISNAGGGTLTVTDTYFTGNSATTAGGGIYSELGTATVTNGTFSSNTAPQGGGFDSYGANVTISNSTFSSNTATNYGAGILNYNATLMVTNSTFSDNIAGWGGAISSNTGGTATVTDSTFSGNNATLGGGIYIDTSTATVTSSTFSSNTATGSGGGIYSRDGSLTVANGTFAGNSAGTFGGGIYGEQATGTDTITVTNSTFSANGATGIGEGIYNDTGALNLMNTILANSTGGGDCFSNSGVSTDINNLIVSNNIGCGTPVSSANPVLGPLTNNGGITQTMELLTGSPAIDAGDDTTCAAAPISNKDQRGVTRPFGAHCDIGAYELNKGKLTVQSVGTYDGHILESGENTNAGGTLDSTSTTFNLGDDASDRQYRAIVSFDTSALPDNAVITRVTLKIKRQGQIGTNPFSILGWLKADIRKLYFGTGLALVASDFQAAPHKSAVGSFNATPTSNWYFSSIGSAGYPYINKTGTTQFRLRFLTDDNNNNIADYMKFYSGNYSNAAARPMLIIEYVVW